METFFLGNVVNLGMLDRFRARSDRRPFFLFWLVLRSVFKITRIFLYQLIGNNFAFKIA